MSEKNKKKTKAMNSVKYWLLYAIVFVWASILKIRVNKNDQKIIKRVEGPCLILGSHHSAVDFAGAVMLAKGKKTAFVVSSNMYYRKLHGKLFNMLGNLIPVKQFQVDLNVIRKIREFVKAGVSIVIYPEGRVSMAGQQGKVDFATAKLVKMLNIPVLYFDSPGWYAQRPRYCDKVRFGSTVYAKGQIIIPKEEIENMTLDDIKKRLDCAFVYNDMEFQEKEKLFSRLRREVVRLKVLTDYYISVQDATKI